MKQSQNYWVACFLAGILSVTLAAADSESDAQNALLQGNPQHAYELLVQNYHKGHISNQGLFLLAMASKEAGKLDESEKYLTELLQKEPNAPRIKLELAEVTYRKGNVEKTKVLLLEVKSSNPPPKVGENIDKFLASLEGGTPQKWSASAAIGMMYDTNVNMGPNRDTILMYNLPFTLDTKAKNNADWATTLKAGVDYTHPLSDKWAIQAEGGISNTNYKTISNYDSTNLSFSAGPSYHHQQWSLSLPYILNRMTIGHEQSYYSVSQGIAPQIAYQVSPQIMVQSSLAYQRKHYLSSSDRDGHSLTFSPSVRYFLNDHSYTSLGGYVGRDASGVDIWSNHSRGINVGYFNAFAPNWNLYCSPSYSKTDYEGIETAYGVRRSDNHFEMTTNLNYRIDAWKTNVALSFTHINNASSIDMYHYQRQQTMLTLTKNF
ncbi:MAG: surface lipoprotein assembly modifier [Sulfuricurvum sp.]